jgi:hypothetical protein
VIGRGLTVAQTAVLVRELAHAPGPAATAATPARRPEGRAAPVRRGGRTARSALETMALDVTTLRRSAGRLQACLAATPLAAIDPAAGVVHESLVELRGMLAVLCQTIAGVTARAQVA